MLTLLLLTLAAEPDAAIRNLLLKVKRNEDLLAAELDKFGYNERIERADGAKREVEEFEVTNYKGRKIRRLLARNGVALAGGELAKESRRVEKLIGRMEKGDIPPLSNRRLRVEDLIAAASFANVRAERVQGREVTACDFAPRPNHKARNLNERLIQNVLGTLWIDEKALQVARADFALRSALKVAGGLFFSMKPGTRFSERQLWFGDRIWLPSTNQVTFKARAMLAKSLDIEAVTTRSQYRRFDVSAEEARP